MAFLQLQVTNQAVYADDSLKNHDALNARCFRQRWISRLDPVDQISGGHIAAHFDRARPLLDLRWLLGHGRRNAAGRSAESA